MKSSTPHSIYAALDWIKQSPQLAKKKHKVYHSKVRVFFLKFIGYSDHYTTMVKGHFVGVMIYLKSNEFKQRNKAEMVLAPIKKFKTDPVRAFSVLLVTCFLGSTTYFIYLNTSKIITGTKALRAPASAAEIEEPILEFKKIKYEVQGKSIFLDVVITANSLVERDKLIPMEREIEEQLSGVHIAATQLPLSQEDMHAIEVEMLSKIAGTRIKSVEVKQVLEGRPKYFMQMEKMVMIKDLNLQLFLEDTKRNRQVYLDFTALASNRNAVLFLKDHDVEVRDYLNMHVEPVIPQLPIEEEGRQIIKDKVKLELNNFLKEAQIEGKILEIYVDYLIAS
jgi:flagellar basal body-associated protein FliL